MFENKKILVTGACGTVGSALITMLIKDYVYKPDEVIGIDHNESELFFQDQKYLNHPNVKFVLANIRDKEKLGRLMRGVNIVFHAAALKHVVLCERSPFEAVQSNIHGVQNVILAASENNVEHVVFTSSDKAVNPTNVMGTSKLMGERLITAANSNRRGKKPVFYSTRFGNVLGSNGSVIPIFKNQIAQGGPVTLTDTEMTRFIMSIEEAVRLVIDSVSLAKGGEVFVTKMPTIRIADLAEVMINELAESYGHEVSSIKIEVIGTKPGEKLYEELMSNEETRRAVELEHYFSVLPAFRGLYADIEYNYDELISEEVNKPYVSATETPLNNSQIKNFLHSAKLLEVGEEGIGPAMRYWPGDKESI